MIMAAAVATGLVIYSRTRQSLDLNAREKFGIAIGAFCGGMIGAKLPFLLADWQGFISGAAWFDNGKTIVSGLVGGYLGVQVAEWTMGIQAKMCDSLAVPLAAAIGVGRLACFSAGCCYGTVTSLPWGVDFGDGQTRHPTQLYESAFHLLAAVVLYQFQRRNMFRGQLVKIYFVSYFVFRFLTEFIRPEAALWLGLTGYQWAVLVLAPFFAFWCCPVCRQGKASKTTAPAPKIPAESPSSYMLNKTGALCPTCLKPVSGTIVVRDGKIYMQRQCPEHGKAVALVSSDRRHYYLRDEVPHALPINSGCSCSSPCHKTCVALLELTGACNLRCPVCYAQSPNGLHRSFDDLCFDLEAFLKNRGQLDVLQLSGGEPLLHPEVLQIIDFCKTLPIQIVMINTNGLELLNNQTLAAELANRKPRLELCLQIDGLDSRSHLALRGEDLLPQKRTIIDKIIELDLPTTLVCTVTKGVNERQLGDLLRWGLEIRQCRGITFQPAAWCGRFGLGADPLDRITLADVVGLLVQQTEGFIEAHDFKPLPCSNPNCCSITYIARPRNRPMTPLTRLFPYEKFINHLSDRLTFNLQDVRKCCGFEGRAEDFFRIVIKPFMDAYTYDQQRIDECCVHIIRPGGGAVSFCRFNTLERNRIDGQQARTQEYIYGVGRE